MSKELDPEVVGILSRALPGCRVVASTMLAGGVSARAVVVDVVDQGVSRRVVVRRPTRDTPERAALVAQREYRVLEHCAAQGIPAPAPCAFDERASAVVVGYADGMPELAPTDLPGMCERMARELARIHGAGGVGALAFLERYEARAERSVRRVPERLDLSLDEPRVRDVLSRAWPWQQHNPDVLLHGDYWPGNLLWRSGELTCVLDWEEAAVGDPLADVSVARLDVLWAFGERAMRDFTRCYGTFADVDWRNLAFWDLRTALRPMSNLARWAAVYPLEPILRPDITEDTMRAGHQRFVAQALESLG